MQAQGRIRRRRRNGRGVGAVDEGGEGGRKKRDFQRIELPPKGRSAEYHVATMSQRWVTGQLPIIPVPGGSVRSPRGATYLLGALMGEGSFGAVFDCIGPFDQPFALKMFRPGERPYSQVREEWQREAERLYRLRHPNVVYVFDYFESQGLFYLVLERCDHSLSDMLGRAFTDRLVVDLSRQILFALQYLSDSEIIHNDLHAGNILVQQGDELVLKLSDLGIAQELSGQRAVRPQLVRDNPAVSSFPKPATPLTAAEAASLRTLMGAVVSEGSGRVLAPSGVTLAKTGTAEYGTGM